MAPKKIYVYLMSKNPYKKHAAIDEFDLLNAIARQLLHIPFPTIP